MNFFTLVFINIGFSCVGFCIIYLLIKAYIRKLNLHKEANIQPNVINRIDFINSEIDKINTLLSSIQNTLRTELSKFDKYDNYINSNEGNLIYLKEQLKDYSISLGSNLENLKTNNDKISTQIYESLQSCHKLGERIDEHYNRISDIEKQIEEIQQIITDFYFEYHTIATAAPTIAENEPQKMSDSEILIIARTVIDKYKTISAIKENLTKLKEQYGAYNWQRIFAMCKNICKDTAVNTTDSPHNNKTNHSPLSPYISYKGHLLNNIEMGFNANIRLIKSLANHPVMQNIFKRDKMTIKVFNIEYLKKWQPHRFNSANQICDLRIISADDIEKYSEYETYKSNEKLVVKIPQNKWHLTKFYSMFCAARRVELKTLQDNCFAKEFKELEDKLRPKKEYEQIQNKDKDTE